jgi:hypothetical protein
MHFFILELKTIWMIFIEYFLTQLVRMETWLTKQQPATTRGQCYEHTFRQRNIGVFLKNQCYDAVFAKTSS